MQLEGCEIVFDNKRAAFHSVPTLDHTWNTTISDTCSVDITRQTMLTLTMYVNPLSSFVNGPSF